MGIALLILSIVEMIFAGSMINTGDLTKAIDQVIVLVLSVSYIVGAIISRANYNLGLLKPRDK
jgi:hypothetical protein